MSIDRLHALLTSGKTVLMDGAMGTEILNRGHKTTLPLWSAEVLLENPEVVQQIHEDYIAAGAEIISTNTFSTTRRMFNKKGMGEQARKACIAACTAAKKARDHVQATHPVYIAGSVAPLEDCYSPELTPPQNELDAEHQELAGWLRDGGVDFILIETMITLRETQAAIRAAQRAGLPFAVSFCCNDKLELLGGELLSKVVPTIEEAQPLFIGVNCVSPAIASKTVKYLRSLTKLPISVYAQGDGAPDDDQGWKFDGHTPEKAYLKTAATWAADGAHIIGGCCGTSPSHIQALNALRAS